MGDSPASISSTTQFEASATLDTPPEEVGYNIGVEIAGRITATGHSRVVSRCRGARVVEIAWTRPDGRVDQGETQPSSRKGHFGAGFTLTYGNDVPVAGGPFNITISTPKESVGGRRIGTSYLCKPLTETLTVDIPPSASF